MHGKASALPLFSGFYCSAGQLPQGEDSPMPQVGISQGALEAETPTACAEISFFS